MKSKTSFLIAVWVLCSATCLAQVMAISVTSNKTNNAFYATLEDYKNNKPIPNNEIEDRSWNSVFGVSTLKVKTDGETKKIKLSNCPSDLCVYNKSFVKIYKGELYHILAYGNFCVYQLYSPNSQGNNFFYSETIKGDFNKLSKGFKKYLKQYQLEDAYDAEYAKAKVKEKGETNSDIFNKEWAVDLKYYNLINEKMK